MVGINMLKNKVALITGGGQGVGQGIAKSLGQTRRAHSCNRKDIRKV
jgi:NAD(P)-dependent dehydrogenase (short-subunit alcohol dehydrogenase family)